MCFPDFGVFVETELKSIKTLCNSRKKILQDFGLHLIGDKFPSMNRSAKASLGKFNDKNIVQSLKDFVRDDQSLKQARIDMFKSLDKRKPIKILGDDYVIEKIGKSIDDTSFQFDYVQNKQVNGFLLVDMAVRQDDMIYAIVFAQRDPVNKNKFKKSSESSDEEKTRQILIRKLIIQLRKELKLAGFSNKKITVILDRWYPTDGLFKFLRSLKVNFVVGIKKSALVLLPDRKKFLLSLIQRRGRPMSDFTKTVRIKDYLEKYQKMHSFFDPDRKTTLLFKSASVNLNIAKQVKVFAFMYENQTEWRYIVCNIKIQTAKQAYNLHKDR